MREIKIGDKHIYYELTYKNVKNINMRINPKGEIFVSANKRVPAARVDEFVLSKANLVFKALEKFKENENYLKIPKQYISGENFKILGKDLTLKVLFGEKENVYTDEIYLFLTIKDIDNFEAKKKAINKWLDIQCITLFYEISAQIYEKFKKYGVATPQIKIREMKSRWGSCHTTKNIITLNKNLIEKPRYAIEYVVLHEYCHFIHPNHSKDFYAFVYMMMPDWKNRKKFL